MKRTKLFVRLSGLGEARAEGGVATVVLGLAAGTGLWVLSRWEEAVLSLVATGLVSVFGMLRSFLGLA
jgi:hypothetical protein